jgi:hypothetical protein
MNPPPLLVTILAMAFASCGFAQSVADLEKEKVRMRIIVTSFTVHGVSCVAGPLTKNKRGREVIDESSRPAGHVITVVDLSAQPVKIGEVRDLWLYPSSNGTPPRYAYSASNALLDRQGNFVLPMTPALMERMGFEATLKEKNGRVMMKKKAHPAVQSALKEHSALITDRFAVDGFSRSDPFGDGEEITLMAPTEATMVKLYPTSKSGVFALSAAAATKTFA